MIKALLQLLNRLNVVRNANAAIDCRRLALAGAVILLAAGAEAQSSGPPSPPIGPPNYRSGHKEIGIGLISGMVKTKVQEIVTSTNELLKANGQSPRVELLLVRVHQPTRVATENTDSPNQWFVKIPMNIRLKVTLSVVSDRQINIPLDVNVSCQDWHTNSGKIRVTARPGPISVDGGNILEEVVRIRDYVDGRVKSHLPNLGQINPGLDITLPCATIGVSPGEPPDYRFGFIAYNKPARIPPFAGTRPVPSVEVRFRKLKRLSAHGLYQPVEEIRLEAYANQTSRQSPILTMREGDELNLNFPPFSVKTDAVDLLVVIANINQQPNGLPQDSAFDAWPKSMNFSPGLHTLRIAKVDWESPGPGRPKPTARRVPAYELTYEVVSSHPELLR